jgi:nucleotide-binding universal stress UspA family protein
LLKAADDPIVTREVRSGDVAGEVVDVARETQAGLIVMSSHGHRRQALALGSIAEKVLHAAPCPIWVVRGPTQPKHVLITLDGSELSEAALRRPRHRSLLWRRGNPAARGARHKRA